MTTAKTKGTRKKAAKKKAEASAGRYRFRKGFPSRGVDAKDAKAQIERVARDAGGIVDGEMLYDATIGDRESPCGRIIFHESDKELVRRARVNLADDMINAIQVVRVRFVKDEEVEEVRRVFVGFSDDPGDEKVYAARAKVLSDADRRESVLRDAVRTLTAWADRYGDLAELQGLTKAIVRFLGRYKE